MKHLIIRLIVFGLSALEIDSASTSLRGENALKSSRTVPTFTTGFGAVLDLNDFNIGCFLGWDFDLGSNGQKWNYSNDLWNWFWLLHRYDWKEERVIY